MKVRTTVLFASLASAAALSSGRPAAAQGPSVRELGGPALEKAIASTAGAATSPTLGTAWSRALSAAFVELRRLSDGASAPVDLRPRPTDAPAALRSDLPSATPVKPERPRLGFGAVQAAPVDIPSVTASVVDTRGESFETPGLQVTLPWKVP